MPKIVKLHGSKSKGKAGKSAKPAGAGNGKTAPHGENTIIKSPVAKKFTKAIEHEQAEVERIMADARAACEPHRQHVQALMKQAAEQGLPKSEFASALRWRKLGRKQRAIRDGLTREQRNRYDMIQQCLGDYATTPLGHAAAMAEEPEESKTPLEEAIASAGEPEHSDA
jgi:hypothetical protein